MAATTATPESDLGPIIALRSLMRTIWRKRRVWLLTALLGVIIGASLHFVLPHKYSAVTNLYLAQPVGSDPVQAMENDVSLLHTEAVAGQAVSANHLPITPDSLLSHYSGLALSNNILSIKYNGTTQSNAVSSARDVAQAFLLVQAKELSLQTDVLVRGLRSQIAALNSAVDGLNGQINALATSAPSPQASDKLTELVNERSADATQVSQLQSQIQQALANQQSADRVSHVLDPAAIVPVSAKRVTLMDALSGLIIGLAAGLALVIFRALLVERPLDRATVAATFGAPVELSLGRYKSPRLMRRRRLRRRLRHPSPVLRMLQGRLRGHVESAPGSSLAVVAAGTAEPAALAVGALALALSADGHEVVVVDAADERPLATLLGLTATPQTMDTFQSPRLAGPRVRVFVVPEDPAQMAQKAPPDDADAVLVLATLDPAFGADHLASWVTDAVMVLRPKGFPFTRLTAYREMLRTAGVSLRSVFLLGADAEDDSSGAPAAVDPRFTPASSPVPST
jgi:capsular polysaccharide biosynthesis protein